MNRLTIVLSVLFLIVSCDKKKEQVESQAYKFYENPDQMSEDYHTVVTELGKKKYELWSKRVEFFSQKKYVDCLDSMIVKFVNKKSGEITHIYAHAGNWKQRSNDLKAMKNVSVITSDGKKLYTDTLYFNSSTSRLYSDTDMMFVDKEDTTWGTSFTSDTDLENLMITNQRSVYSEKNE